MTAVDRRLEKAVVSTCVGARTYSDGEAKSTAATLLGALTVK
jgi:hypothetical protein